MPDEGEANEVQTQKTIVEHTVPEFILKQFRGSNPKLYVYDKLDDRIRYEPISRLAQKPGFYDAPADLFTPEFADQVDLQVVEHALGRLEGRFARAVADLLKDVPTNGLPDDQRFRLAHLMVIQLLRTFEFREWMVETNQKVAQVIAENLAEKAFPGSNGRFKYRVEFDERMWPLYQGLYMLDRSKVGPLIGDLCRLIWRVGINPTGRPLYISDNPVVRQAHNHNPYVGGRSLNSRGLEIAFPLSPTVMLILHERTAFAELSADEGRAVILTTDQISYYNGLQVEQSYRQVFCSENDFDLAQQLCKQSPAICSPERERFSLR